MSSTKTNAEMLKNIKQFNKVAREKRAAILGWKRSSDLILYLEAEVKDGRGSVTFTAGEKSASAKTAPTAAPKTSKPKPVVKGGTRPTIHIVDILDASGSMAGSKFNNALEGINIGVENLKKDKEPVDYTYTLCDFSGDIIFRVIGADVHKVGHLSCVTRGSTSLLDAIGESIDKVEGIKLSSEDKVLVNIYTDGEENSSRKFTASQIDESIKHLSKKGWTFTFIGTAADVKTASDLLSIHKSNTLVYDGTGAGLKKAFATTASARSTYSAKVSLGEDVSKGFYKDIK